MRALILAAGRGSRMKIRTEDRPKCLVELAGHALLDLQLAAIRSAGIKDVAIVSGYMGHKLEGRGLRLFRNERWNESNMVASLRVADEWLRGDACIVSYADIFYPKETVESLAAGIDDLAISYDPDWLTLWSARFEDPLSDAETFRRDAGGQLVEIGRRPKAAAEVEGQYMGLLKFSPAGWARIRSLLDRLPAGEIDRLDMTSLLSRLIQAGERIGTVPTAPGWGEIDSETDLAYYDEEVQAGRLRLRTEVS